MNMRKYELVVIIDPRMQKAEIDETVSSIYSLLWDALLDKDEIWMLDLAYEISGNDRAYFLSVYFEADNELLNKIDSKLKLMNKVLRYFVYNMWAWEKFLKYHEINKFFEDSEEERKRQENESAFVDMDVMSK